MKHYQRIAFRDIDREGDIWAERVFLFETQEAARAFFVADNPVLISLYTDADYDPDDDKTLHDFKVVLGDSTDFVLQVKFRTRSDGEVEIRPMLEGFIISE